MGTLRILLALSVAYGHAGLVTALGFPLVPGDTAVEAFYAISGFYMALVLNETYRPDNSSYLLFIGNRFARLFPTYAVVAVATLVLAVFIDSRSGELPFVAFWRSLPHLPVSDAILLFAPQVFLLGLDLYPFLTLHGGSLSFIADFNTDPGPLQNLLVIPPAWTLGVEFAFYLVAPFIVRRPTRTIAAVLFASIALRLFLQFGFGLQGDPWSYRFFPSELALFLVGALGYRVYRSIKSTTDRRTFGMFAVACVCVVGAVLTNRWHGISRVGSTGLLLLLLLAIPSLFRGSRSNTIDRLLGELSYPIYICHFLVIWTVDYLLAMQAGIVHGFVILALTFVGAVLLYFAVDRPIDAWRHRRLGPRPATAVALSRSEAHALPSAGRNAVITPPSS